LTARNKNLTIKDAVSLGCLALAAAFLVLSAVKLTALAAARPAEPNPSDPNATVEDTTDTPAGIKEIVTALKTKNMFVPPPPPPQPPKQVNGIFGNQAFIAGKWYAVGDTVPPGAKVVAIESTCVKLLWQGKEITLAPIMAASAAGPAKPPPRPTKKPKQIKPKAGQPKQEAAAAVAAEVDDLAWLDLPADLKEKFRKYWDTMTPEQKEQAKERWNNMSQEQKDQAIEGMSRMP